jgi:ArsR family transcriptional regulator
LVVLPNIQLREVCMTIAERKLYEAKARVLKALAHPVRLWMAEQLAGGERCVCELVNPLGLDFSTVSKHLAVMREAGIVAMEKRGKQVFYSLKVPCILGFMGCVEAVLKGNAQDQACLVGLCDS